MRSHLAEEQQEEAEEDTEYGSDDYGGVGVGGENIEEEEEDAEDESTSSSVNEDGAAEEEVMVPSVPPPPPTSVNNLSKPHKAQDAAWEAMRSVHGKVGLQHFRLLQRLGSGDIGCVYLAELAAEGCSGTGTRYFAIKVMDKRTLAKRNKLQRAETERRILEALDHPFLPTLYAHIDDNRRYSCLVMDFCPGGDLHVLRQLQNGRRFREDAVRFYAAEVLLALEYLHMMGVVYRDLKPENVLVREDGHIMLSDFDLSLQCSVNPTVTRVQSDSATAAGGWASPPTNGGGLCSSSAAASCMASPLGCVTPCSVHPIASCLPIRRIVNNGSSVRDRRRRPRRQQLAALPELLAEPTSARSMSFVGTHEYLAPEIILGEGHGAAVDWWTLGIFMYELMYSRTPFKGADNEATLTNVVAQLLRFPPATAEAAAAPSAAAQDLIRGLLAKEPRKRMGAVKGSTEIKQHEFFHGVSWALIRCATPPFVPAPFALQPTPDGGVDAAQLDVF